MSYPIYHDPDEDMSSEERKRRQTCSSKVTYQSRELAEAATVGAEQSGGLAARDVTTYQCRFCGLWHLSRRRA